MYLVQGLEVGLEWDRGLWVDLLFKDIESLVVGCVDGDETGIFQRLGLVLCGALSGLCQSRNKLLFISQVRDMKQTRRDLLQRELPCSGS